MKEILRFQPILKQTLWGGEKIIPFKGMDLALTNVGESWELSGVAGNETTVVGMPDMTLNQLVSVYGPSLLGRKNHERFGNEFPLLIKFIDARENLSIQVHPEVSGGGGQCILPACRAHPRYWGGMFPG